MRLDVEVRSSGTRRDNARPAIMDCGVPSSKAMCVVAEAIPQVIAIRPRDGVAVIIRRAG